MKHLRFPDIEQFRNVIRNVKHKTHFVGLDEKGDAIYDGLRSLPTIKYMGTVKLHGCCSSLIKDINTGEISIQSRERIISVENDNYGFAAFVNGIDLNKLFDMVPTIQLDAEKTAKIEADDEDKKSFISIYGEWCAGNIQKGVALSGLPKMFVIFSVNYCGIWLSVEERKSIKIPESKIYNILDYENYIVDIDFNHPELIQNKLVDITLAVEQECPVGKAFGVSGTGEGVVYAPIDPNWNSSRYWFKVKGTKHSVTKTKQLASIDVEKVNSVNELIENVVTENRLQQGFDVIKHQKNVNELDRSHIGDFIKWVFNDVIKEEKDTIVESGLSEKELGGPIAKKAKDWLFKKGI